MARTKQRARLSVGGRRPHRTAAARKQAAPPTRRRKCPVPVVPVADTSDDEDEWVECRDDDSDESATTGGCDPTEDPAEDPEDDHWHREKEEHDT